MLTRMFAYFTVVAYLVVGTVVVRVMKTESHIFNFSQSYLAIFTESKIQSLTEVASVEAPVMNLSFSSERPMKKMKIVERKNRPLNWKKLQLAHQHELPFSSPIKLAPIIKETSLETNLIALYENFAFTEKKVEVATVEEKIQDEVKVTQSVAKEIEPEFFEYEAKPETIAQNKVIEKTDPKIESEDIVDLITQPKEMTTQKSPEIAQTKPDYSNLVASTVQEAQEEEAVQNPSFDVKKVMRKPLTPVLAENTLLNSQKLMAPQSHEASVTIHAIGLNLKGSEKLQGFEVRFQDQSGGTLEDYGGGTVVVDDSLAASKMTRSIVMLKKGYVPTSTELILEEGSSEVSIPLIEEEVLYDLNGEFEQKGSVGSLLVELDDETEIAKLDVPFGKVIKLNGELKPTENEDFRYELFLGVKAGNAMISYQKGTGEVVNRIVHVHENELTYDANFFEDVINEKIKLYQEDLLGKETSPLILTTEQVKVFAKESATKKINQNTYHLNFNTQNLGGRRYVELTHQSEPIFVGARDNNNLTIPSESFMRYILSNFENSKLGDRCLVQVNLSQKISSYEVSAESTGSSLVTYHQVLDRDGKFYESVSEKTRKIVILGESQASGETSKDAKINIKIRYLDGSHQYLSSYCSPNTYLVEQL